jgi:hypothetical protein
MGSHRTGARGEESSHGKAPIAVETLKGEASVAPIAVETLKGTIEEGGA